MTYYSEQALKIAREVYPKDHLIDKMIQCKQFMDRKFAANLDLDKIASKSFLSKFHFIRLFKSLYGTTPHQYLITVRLDHAKRLLKTDLSVSEVCSSVGFDSPSSFTGLFKKYTGRTPSQFRAK